MNWMEVAGFAMILAGMFGLGYGTALAVWGKRLDAREEALLDKEEDLRTRHLAVMGEIKAREDTLRGMSAAAAHDLTARSKALDSRERKIMAERKAVAKVEHRLSRRERGKA